MNAAKRLPAYGRDLVAMQRAGHNVGWLCIATEWHLGRALPRVVVTDDTDIANLDLSIVAGLECTVAHEGQTGRALDIAELAIRNGATLCGVHDQHTGKSMTTAEVLLARGVAA
jgi:hypothetical protein